LIVDCRAEDCFAAAAVAEEKSAEWGAAKKIAAPSVMSMGSLGIRL
jgi:hypothetical protein